MACRLFGTKPLSEPMMTYCQLDPKEYISMKYYLNCKRFSFKKMHLNISSRKWWSFCLSFNVLTLRVESHWPFWLLASSKQILIKIITMVHKILQGECLCFWSEPLFLLMPCHHQTQADQQTQWILRLLYPPVCMLLYICLAIVYVFCICTEPETARLTFLGTFHGIDAHIL